MKNIYPTPKVLNRVILILILVFSGLVVKSQNIAITDSAEYNAEISAMLDVQSNSKGLLIPRLDSIQRNDISNPATGLLVYDTDNAGFFYFDGINWLSISQINNSGTGALFAVLNATGDTVFAVYDDGAKVTVPFGSKGKVGGFAVSGRTSAKDLFEDNYLYVTPDSTRVTFETTSYKGKVGGFAVSGRTSSKAGTSTTSLINLFPDNYFIGDSAGINTTGTYNNFIGYKAGAKNTSGFRNTFMGYKSGYSNIDGYNNLFIGLESGYKNSSGYYNLFLGNKSGYSNLTGYHNSFIGVNSGYSNSSGKYNVFIGEAAGYSNNTGWENIYIGMYAGNKSTGNIAGNVFMGSYAGYDNISGHSNSYIGHHSGWHNVGYGNTFLGYSSGSSSSGSYNTYMGRMAGIGNTGSNNVLIGNLVARYVETGGSNTFLGTSAGQNLKTANNNVLIGYFAGGSKPDSISEKNVFIGYQAGYNAYGNNQLYIETSTADSTAALIWGDFTYNILTFNANVGIGTTTPEHKLDVIGDVNVTGAYLIDGSKGSFADFVFEDNYKLESIEEHSDFMWNNKHLPALKSANELRAGGSYDISERREQLLEELEKAHIYIEQLNNKIKTLESENSDLKNNQDEILNKIEKLEKLINSGNN